MTDQEKLRIYLKALTFIRDNEGKVCSEYETCSHVACNSSYSAWVTSDEAIKTVEGNPLYETTQGQEQG